MMTMTSLSRTWRPHMFSKSSTDLPPSLAFIGFTSTYGTGCQCHDLQKKTGSWNWINSMLSIYLRLI
jgi:hypothetical protein